MTPKEKVKELIEGFAEAIPGITWGVLLERDWVSAKACARICVEEILNEQVGSDYLTPEAYNLQKEYWNEVLTHLKH
jgi:hypothetical protein